MESAAESLVTNGWQLLAEEYRQLSGVGGEVAELRDDVATMNAVLRMQSEAADEGGGAVDHFVREWMKQLRELAYDAEDCVDLYKLRIKTPPSRWRGSSGVRLWFKHHLDTLLARRRLAGEITALRARAVAIGERHTRYGVGRDALLRRSPASSSLPLPPVPALLAPSSSSAHALGRASDSADARHRQLVGIDKQIDALAARLKGESETLDDDDDLRRLRVLSIVGFGGLGKTTLAVEVCRRLEAEFPWQAMVSVSQAFESGRDLRRLLKRVVEQVVKAKIDKEDEIKEAAAAALDEIDRLDDNKLEAKLGKLLHGKRYLIVIDDVWTIRAWETVRSMFPDNNCGSGIIVTTRIENVARACSPSIGGGHHIHQMEALDPDASKRLFISRTFGNKQGCPKELEDVMGKILKRCAGLPLAIVSIASVLATYTSSGSQDKWESVYRSIGSQMESHPTLEGMRQIVTLSYNHLPHELKSCMMYLSIFPEDYEIEKYRLLCRWIAEGMVMEKRGFTPMEVAECYLDELVSRNMIQLQVSFGYHWTLQTCRVHDMLLDVMASKSLECNFVSLIGGPQYAGMSYDRIRRLSIQGDDRRRRQSSSVLEAGAKKNMVGRRRRHDNNGIDIKGMNVQHVRSLSIFHQKGGQQQLLDHLAKFTLMRVLDLEGCVGLTKDHLQCICRLYLLRFLSFKGTDIREVPPQIEKLEHLHTLDVRDTPSGGCHLPETVRKLYQLERLQTSHSSDASRMWRLPVGLSNMTKLREVGFSVLGNSVDVARELGELEHLQELVVYVDAVVFNTEVLPQFAQSLSRSHSLRRLIIGEIGFGYILGSFLDALDPPPMFLRYLMLAGGVNHLPPWIGKLTYLVQINISWARLDGDKLFDGLCKCPSLRIITILQRCYDGPQLVARADKHKFLALANLRVSSASKCPDVIRFEKGSMANLQTLLVNMADNADKRIEGVEHLTGIREVQLWGNKNNVAIGRAMEVLQNENLRRHQEPHKQFQIVVKYE